jgi:hypothetical protein
MSALAFPAAVEYWTQSFPTLAEFDDGDDARGKPYGLGHCERCFFANSSQF